MPVLTYTDCIVRTHERQAFQTLREEMLADIQPLNSVQTELFNQALRAAWQIRRCDAAEQELAAEQPETNLLLLKDKRLDRLYRLRAQAERSYRQALAELRKTQTDRAIRRLPQNHGLEALPVPLDAKGFIAAARQAQGLTPRQPISFPPYQAALDQFLRQRGIAPSAWHAYTQRTTSHAASPA